MVVIRAARHVGVACAIANERYVDHAGVNMPATADTLGHHTVGESP